MPTLLTNDVFHKKYKIVKLHKNHLFKCGDIIMPSVSCNSDYFEHTNYNIGGFYFVRFFKKVNLNYCICGPPMYFRTQNGGEFYLPDESYSLREEVYHYSSCVDMGFLVQKKNQDHKESMNFQLALDFI